MYTIQLQGVVFSDEEDPNLEDGSFGSNSDERRVDNQNVNENAYHKMSQNVTKGLA